MQPKSLKYILDIESAIGEIETVVERCGNSFERFDNDPLAVRSMERLLEIIGEAIGKLLDTDSNINVPDSQRIISLRNRLAHAYDSIINSTLWAIALNRVPKLKEDLAKLRRG